jgi:hypothetical protein
VSGAFKELLVGLTYAQNLSNTKSSLIFHVFFNTGAAKLCTLYGSILSHIITIPSKALIFSIQLLGYVTMFNLQDESHHAVLSHSSPLHVCTAPSQQNGPHPPPGSYSHAALDVHDDHVLEA